MSDYTLTDMQLTIAEAGDGRIHMLMDKDTFRIINIALGMHDKKTDPTDRVAAAIALSMNPKCGERVADIMAVMRPTSERIFVPSE